jgi:hypothetical protein
VNLINQLGSESGMIERCFVTQLKVSNFQFIRQLGGSIYEPAGHGRLIANNPAPVEIWQAHQKSPKQKAFDVGQGQNPEDNFAFSNFQAKGVVAQAGLEGQKPTRMKTQGSVAATEDKCLEARKLPWQIGFRMDSDLDGKTPRLFTSP